MKRESKTGGFLFWVLLLAVIIIGFFLPKSGSLVMLDEFCNVLVIWMIGIYGVTRLCQGRKTFSRSEKRFRMFFAALCIGFAVFFTIQPAADLLSGTTTASFTDIEVTQSTAHTGIFSHHYYLTGTDTEGLRHRLEISGDDYTALNGRTYDTDSLGKSITVEYYEYTGRVVGYCEV